MSYKYNPLSDTFDLVSGDGSATPSNVSILTGSTVDTSLTEIFISGISGSRYLIGQNSLTVFKATFTGKSNDNSQYAKFSRVLTVLRNSTNNPSITSLEIVDSDTGSNNGSPPSGWAVSFGIDTSSNALKVEVTGQNNVGWKCKLEGIENNVS